MLSAKQTRGQFNDIGYSIARDAQGNTYVAGVFDDTTDVDPGPGVHYLMTGTIFADDVFLLKLDVNQNLLWAKQWGSFDSESAYSLQIDPAGFIYVYGNFGGTVDFDPGPGVFNLNAQGASYDVYLNKLDTAGNFVWAKRIAAGSSHAYGTSMTLDSSGNVYVAGYVDGLADLDPGPINMMIGGAGTTSTFVVKFNSAGVTQWGKGMVGNDDNFCFSVAVDPFGNVFTTGGFLGTVDFDPGPGTYNLTNPAVTSAQIYINKLDSSGNLEWAKLVTGGSSLILADSWGRCIMADDSGNVYYTGHFIGTIDFDPGPGTYNLTGVGSIDMFFGKLDSLGNMIWTYSMGGNGNSNEYGYSLAMDSTRDIILSGLVTSDSVDFDLTAGVHMEYGILNVYHMFIARYTPSAQLKCVFLVRNVWLYPYSHSHHLAVYGEKAYVTGGFINSSDFDPCPAVYTQTSSSGIDPDAFFAVYDFSTCDCHLQLTANSTNVLCNGNCTGSATVTTLGGTPPYTYNWFPAGGNNATASNLCSGTYTCIVTDALNDSFSITVNISEPPPLATAISGTDLTCNSICSGSAQVSATGGAPGYTYTWNNSQTTSAISSLCAGNYSVVVTDNNGCTSMQNITVTQPTAIAATISATPTPCHLNNGSVSVNASGGTGTLNYAWQPGAFTTSSVSNLSAGIYTLTITDQNGCAMVLSDTVDAIGVPVTDTSAVMNVMCYSDSTGAATVTATGNGPFTYQWLPFGGSNSTANNLSAGTYNVVVTDIQGCTQTQSVLISEPTAIVVSIAAMIDSCTAGVGSIALSSAGGVGPYTYLWSNSQTASSITGLSGGSYSVTITDNNGCALDTGAMIVSTFPPTLSIANSIDVMCYGDTTGSAMIGASGGTGPYTYNWQPFGGSSASSGALTSGTYSVVVSGSDGCSATVTVAITEPPQLLVTCQTTDENCSFQDGTASVLAAGGSGSYNYTWSNSSSTNSISQLSAGSYSVVITDQNGCSETCTAIVNTTATANADAGSDITIEIRQSTTLSGSGGVYYSWQPASEVECSTCPVTTTSPTVTTTFVLTVTDSAGCMDYDSVVVFVEIPCDDIFVPNAFSPNGDGQNDILYVRGTCIESFTFSIYNRWGEKVFQTSDQSVGWDGTWRGSACENAVFNYEVLGLSTTGYPIKVRGNVSLVK